jgi:exodeoxyribonuclease V beta subunit
LTSYSAIARDQAHPEWEKPGSDEPHLQESLPDNDFDSEVQRLDRFSFVKGAQAGSFLHGVLENIQFAKPTQLAEVIEQQGK